MDNHTPKLTRKQKAFVDAYLSNGFNGTQAAIAAGYSPDTAYSIASENLRKPSIISIIELNLANKPIVDKPVRKKRPCYLYLMQASNGAVKIGIANDPVKRLIAVNTACPLDVILLDYFLDMFAFNSEQELHTQFKHKHIKGEWFSLNDEDLTSIRKRYGKQSR